MQQIDMYKYQSFNHPTAKNPKMQFTATVQIIDT